MSVTWFSWLLLFASLARAMLPLPRSIRRTAGVTPTRLDPYAFEVKFESAKSAPLRDGQSTEEIVRDAIKVLQQHLLHTPLRLVPDYDLHLRDELQVAPFLSTLQLEFDKEAVWINPEISWQDESYTLTVDHENGQPYAWLRAPGLRGLLHGLVTFEQLWHKIYDDPRYLYSLIAPVEINDEPRFAYRGLMLDTSRNFITFPALLRTLDAMRMVKLNVLHWHVTDAQSWPLVIPGFEEVARRGRYLPHQVYSPEQVRQLHAYARQRGISIMVEIDLPGHTSVMARTFPEALACLNKQPNWAQYAAEPPSGQIVMDSNVTAQVIKPLLSRLLSLLPQSTTVNKKEFSRKHGFFQLMVDALRSVEPEKSRHAELKTDALFSTGGDEINMKCYADLGLSAAATDQKLALFISQIHETVRSHGYTPVVWDEIALEHGEASKKLGRDVVVQVWRNSSIALDVVKSGRRIINSPADYVYLDCGMGNWLDNVRNGTSWCDPYKTWQRLYSFDPIAQMTIDQSQLVIGSEVLLWGEQADDTNLDTLLWPRSGALAEVLWSGAQVDLRTGSLAVPDSLDSEQSLLQEIQTHPAPRMHDLRQRLLAHGIAAIPLAPYWCTVRQGECQG